MSPLPQGYLHHQTSNLVVFNNLLSQPVWIKSCPSSLAWPSSGTTGPTIFLSKFIFLCPKVSVFIPYSRIQALPHPELDSILSLTYASSEAIIMKHPSPYQIYKHPRTHFHSLSCSFYLWPGSSPLLTSPHHSCMYHRLPPQEALPLPPHFRQHKNMPYYLPFNTLLIPRYCLALCLCTFFW